MFATSEPLLLARGGAVLGLRDRCQGCLFRVWARARRVFYGGPVKRTAHCLDEWLARSRG
jgi:hypothetical protein